MRAGDTTAPHCDEVTDDASARGKQRANNSTRGKKKRRRARARPGKRARTAECGLHPLRADDAAHAAPKRPTTRR